MLYAFGDCTLHTTRYELRRAGAVIKLEPRVFAVLAYLVQHRDRVVSKHDLLERLCPARYVSDKALVRCIQKARQAIADDPHTVPCIQTFHGLGYRFTAAVVQLAQVPAQSTASSYTSTTGHDTAAVVSPAHGRPLSSS